MSPLKRNDPSFTYSSGSEAEGSSPSRKRARNDVDESFRGVQNIKVFIVTSKLGNDEFVALEKLAQSRALSTGAQRKGLTVLKLCNSPEAADMIVTNIRMRKRFERTIDWKLAKGKAVVTPEWLIDSVNLGTPQACEAYAAIQDLHETTEENCPEPCEKCENAIDSDNEPHDGPLSPTTTEVDWVSHEHEAAPPKCDISKLSYLSNYCCQRPSPLKCPNQELVEQLAVIMRFRDLEGEAMQMLAYEKTIATIKAFPKKITEDTLEEFSKLPYVGQKTMTKTREFLSLGHILETKTILASERYESLSLFTQVFGIGASVARQLYDVHGLRTIEQLHLFYDVDAIVDKDEDVADPDEPPEFRIPHALRLMDELNLKIPRSEVESIRDLVMSELEKIEPGYVGILVGGYRRGKQESNDVDIVIGHSDPSTAKAKITGLSKKLTRRLYKKGVVTNVMHLSSFRTPNAMRTAHWDSLEKALTVFILPPNLKNPKAPRVHRRVDLIFAAPQSFWTAVVGWSGSKMFQRDLRRWAKDKKMLKFDSTGITHRWDSKQIVASSEEDVFRILGLEYVSPEWRNADL